MYDGCHTSGSNNTCFYSYIDFKTVRIFTYSSTREKSNKRSGVRLKTENKTEERR